MMGTPDGNMGEPQETKRSGSHDLILVSLHAPLFPSLTHWPSRVCVCVCMRRRWTLLPIPDECQLTLDELRVAQRSREAAVARSGGGGLPVVRERTQEISTHARIAPRSFIHYLPRSATRQT